MEFLFMWNDDDDDDNDDNDNAAADVVSLHYITQVCGFLTPGSHTALMPDTHTHKILISGLFPFSSTIIAATVTFTLLSSNFSVFLFLFHITH
jgi:hypothetical protein